MSVDQDRKEKAGRKRILFFGLETYSLIGGLQSFNQRLIRHLGLLTIAKNDPPAHAGLLRDKGARIPRVPGVVIRPSGNNRAAFLVNSVLKSIFHGDILLLGNINLIAIAFMSKMFNKKLKVVLFVHGDDVWNDPRYRKKKFYDEFFLKSVDCIASVSWYTARAMAREFHLPLGMFRLMPNATDLIARRHEKSPREKKILAVSRLDAHDSEKNIDKLIQAMVYISKYEPGVILEVVGDGVLRPGLECLASRLGVAHCVQFLGRLSDGELRDAYARAAVFALPSSKEGFGIVYLEAWQFGLPVICSKFGASCEIVSDGEDGFVVDPSDVKELANRILRLIGDRKLANHFGESGYEKVKNKYSDSQYGENLKNLINDIYLL